MPQTGSVSFFSLSILSVLFNILPYLLYPEMFRISIKYQSGLDMSFLAQEYVFAKINFDTHIIFYTAYD
jgi:hypothetical protein